MSMQFDCARCTRTHTGLHTLVEKCWTLCPSCAETVMSQVGEVSPWQNDGRTVVLPDTFDGPFIPSMRLATVTR
jgi:hypothetical protein